MNFASYDLALFIGIVCTMLGGFLLIVLVFPERARFSILDARNLRAHLEDYKNPNIVAGGLLGIIKWLFISGIILICIGLVIRLGVWLFS